MIISQHDDEYLIFSEQSRSLYPINLHLFSPLPCQDFTGLLVSVPSDGFSARTSCRLSWFNAMRMDSLWVLAATSFSRWNSQFINC